MCVTLCVTGLPSLSSAPLGSGRVNSCGCCFWASLMIESNAMLIVEIPRPWQCSTSAIDCEGSYWFVIRSICEE